MGTDRMHCQNEFDRDFRSFDEKKMLRWYRDDYSTSKHLPLLYSIPISLGAKVIGEIGFGRSTKVLELAAARLGVKIIVCDRYNYTCYLSFGTRYILGDAAKFYAHPEIERGADFLFLDYFSTRKMSRDMILRDLNTAFKRMRQNGIVAVHDTIEERYNGAAAIHAFKKRHERECEIITFPYGFGLTLIRRTSKSKHGAINPKSIKKKDTEK